MSILVSIENLLSGDFVEGARMEFKKGWNPTAVLRSVCAFANDFGNEDSGYIVIGVEEKDGRAIRPVKGFDINKFEQIQKELIGYCNLIQPTFFPRLSLEEIDGKTVLVIWVPAGSNRPYKVPDDVLAKHKKYNYRIRQFSSTVIPNREQEEELIQLTAKIPFDDRVNSNAKIDDLNFALMREHLSETKSRLYNESAKMSVEELADAMNLSQGAKEHLFPKNIGLLMFSKEPTAFFEGVQIDLVEFPIGLGAKEFNEKTFNGPIQKQLKDALSYIKTNIIKSKVIKYDDTEIADKVYNYPYPPIEEALANAVYHRNYELRDPIEVRVLPTAIEIISYSGVDPSLKQSDFERGVVRTRRYRNRRVGAFLKELGLTEGKGTGIPIIYEEMRKNDSPKPLFDTDDSNRSFFVVELPIYTDFKNINIGGSIGGSIGDPIELTLRQENVLNIIKADNRISYRTIAKKLDINESAVKKHLNALKEKGVLKRVGGTRGHWEVKFQ